VLQDTRFGADDIDVRCGLHIVFATASPVLTNEVRRYYERLNKHLKTELTKKQQRKESGGGDDEEQKVDALAEPEVDDEDIEDFDSGAYSLILARHESETLAEMDE
jgi:hypothetical protein